jgi:hypothetical protein
VKMTRMRMRIAERLKNAQNTAAMLTTFQETDMSQLMALRGRHKEAFEKKHGVKVRSCWGHHSDHLISLVASIAWLHECLCESLRGRAQGIASCQWIYR